VSEPYENSPLPEPLRGPDQQAHEQVVKRVRGLDLDGKIVIESGGGSDTGWRQVFPLTYDIPLDHPEAVETAEND
jgi:hypothetical protein